MTMTKRLKKSRLTKTTQAMIIQAVVESTMTFNCERRGMAKEGDKRGAKNSGPRISLYMDEQEKRTGP